MKVFLWIGSNSSAILSDSKEGFHDTPLYEKQIRHWVMGII